jgi:hypothetical protein
MPVVRESLCILEHLSNIFPVRVEGFTLELGDFSGLANEVFRYMAMQN